MRAPRGRIKKARGERAERQHQRAELVAGREERPRDVDGEIAVDEEVVGLQEVAAGDADHSHDFFPAFCFSTAWNPSLSRAWSGAPQALFPGPMFSATRRFSESGARCSGRDGTAASLSRSLAQRSRRERPVDAVHELAVGQHDEQREDDAEMDREQRSHRAGGAEREQQQARSPPKAAAAQQREIRPHQVRRGERRIARDLHPDQAGRADRQQNPANRPEQHRQAEERIGRVMAENVGVERRYAGRGEAEQKPVEHAVMQVAPRLREPLVEIVAAMPLAAEIAQRQHVAQRRPDRAAVAEFAPLAVSRQKFTPPMTSATSENTNVTPANSTSTPHGMTA